MLSLEKILEIVKENFTDAYIDDTWVELYKEDRGYIWIDKNNKIICELDIYNNANWQKNIFDNFIELKHYLDIEIKWEDLVDWCRTKGIAFQEKGNVIVCFDLYFYENRTIDVCDVLSFGKDRTIKNRSYWRMYNIIKNLVEN